MDANKLGKLNDINKNSHYTYHQNRHKKIENLNPSSIKLFQFITKRFK